MNTTTNTPLFSRKAFTISRVVAAIALFIAASSLLIANAGWFPRFMAPPTPQELDLALRRAGLGPEQVTAAGADALDIGDLFENAYAHLDNNATYTLAASNLAAAKAQYQDLLREVRSGVAIAQQQEDFATATAAYSDAQDDWADAQANFIAAATADLVSEETDVLDQLRANQRWHSLPLEFSVVERTEEQWVELREALANERIAEEAQQAPDQDAQLLLSQLRIQTNVSAAAAHLNSNLITNNSAWQNEMME